MAKKRKAGIFERVLKAFFVIFALCFVLSAGFIAKDIYEDKKSSAAFDELREVQEAAPASEEASAYDKLHAMNADYTGWLKLDGTRIDYPVMITPSEPEYYLRRAFDQSYSMNGTPFVGEGCDNDSESFIIYGHDMDDGSMFGTLESYAEQSFWQAHPQIVYYTKEGMRVYEIFAVLKTRILDPGEVGFRYYNNVGDLTPEQFANLSSWLKENALYDTGIAPSSGEQILMLSTCSYHTANGRFVVAARRIQ